MLPVANMAPIADRMKNYRSSLKSKPTLSSTHFSLIISTCTIKNINPSPVILPGNGICNTLEILSPTNNIDPFLQTSLKSFFQTYYPYILLTIEHKSKIEKTSMQMHTGLSNYIGGFLELIIAPYYEATI